MANVPDLTGKSSKFRDIKEIMQNPSMKAKLNSYVDEAVAAKQKIQFEQENIKKLRENAVDDLGIKPAIFNQFVAMVYNNDYNERRDKLEELVNMVDVVMAEYNLLPSPNQEDD